MESIKSIMAYSIRTTSYPLWHQISGSARHSVTAHEPGRRARLVADVRQRRAHLAPIAQPLNAHIGAPHGLPGLFRRKVNAPNESGRSVAGSARGGGSGPLGRTTLFSWCFSVQTPRSASVDRTMFMPVFTIAISLRCIPRMRVELHDRALGELLPPMPRFLVLPDQPRDGAGCAVCLRLRA